MTERREVPEPGPTRVLALEDDAGSPGLAGTLENAGYEVRAVRRVSELVPLLNDDRYEAVVLDLAGDRIGPDACREIETAIREMQSGGGAPRPAVLALADRSETGEVLHQATVWITVEDRGQIVREVESALLARRLQRARAEIQRLISAIELARTTAHDLAQPLTTILARAQLLQISLKPEDPAHRSVSIICQEADRLAEIIERFHRLREMIRPPGSPAD